MSREGHELLPIELLCENNAAIKQAIAHAIVANNETHVEQLKLYDARGVRSIFQLQTEISVYIETGKNGEEGISVIISAIILDTKHALIGNRSINSHLFTSEDSIIKFSSDLEVANGFEGLGIGTALFEITEEMIQWVIARFPQYFLNKKVEILLHDVATSVSPQFSRKGWTSRRASGNYTRLRSFGNPVFIKNIQ